MKSKIILALTIASALIAPGKANASNCGWSRYIYNAGEPDNVIHFEGFRDITDGDCVASSMRFNGRFNDGIMAASIYPAPVGFIWEVNDKRGIAQSFAQAFNTYMPALLTDPDHFEEGDRW